MVIVCCPCNLWGLVPDGEDPPTHYHVDTVLGWRDDGRPHYRWGDPTWVEPVISVDWKAVAKELGKPPTFGPNPWVVTREHAMNYAERSLREHTLRLAWELPVVVDPSVPPGQFRLDP